MRRNRGLLVVGALLVVGGLSAFAGIRTAKPGHAGRSFTARYTETYFNEAGEPYDVKKNILRVAADGSFRHITTDGKTIFHDYGFAQGRGFYEVKHGSRLLLRNPTQRRERPAAAVKAEYFTSQEGFAGTEEILGLTAYKILFKNSDGSTAQEVWYAPELGRQALRSRDYKDGRLTHSVEPVSVDFSEPPAEFVRLPDYPERDDDRQPGR